MADRRLYAQFTLDYADSHKIAPLSDAAFRAHVRMILWSRRMLTDGRIPAAMAFVLCDRKHKVLTELTTNDAEAPSLIRDENGDYLLHDFLEHQRSKAQIEASSETNRANGARGGQAKAKRTASDSLTKSLSDSVSERVANLYTETETETTLPSEGGRERLPPPVDNSEPPTRCPEHATTVVPPKCGSCKDARVAHEAWAKQQAIAAHPSRPSAWRPGLCRDHLQNADTCEMCERENREAANVIQGRFGGVA